MCGEQEAWDGNECAVCSFVAPPSKFADPDVDMHKQLDLRAKDPNDLDGGDVAGLNADVNDQDGDGLDDQTGLPVDDEEAGELDQQPILACPVCGFEAEAAHPVSVNTADPQAGASSGDGAAEGDLCPACGKGVMESGTELAEQGIDPEVDPNAEMDDDEVDPRDADPEAEGDPREQPPEEFDDPEADPEELDPDKVPLDEEDEEEEDDAEDDPRADPRKTRRFPQ